MRYLPACVASIVLLLVVGTSVSHARTWQAGATGILGSGIDSMPYRYYLPDNYNPAIEYPLILMLHGAGERGTNNQSQVSSHIAPLIDKTASQFPAILVVPQMREESGWGPFFPADHTPELLDLMINNYSVDTNRLYITGLSMGGYGTMDYLQEYHYYNPGIYEFAAAAPLSGARIDSPESAAALTEVPIWLVHGSNDGTVNVNTSRNVYRAIAGLGPSDPIPLTTPLMGGMTAIDGPLRYTEIAGLGHSGWSTMYNNDQLYNWMFTQSLRETTEVLGDVNQDGVFTMDDLNDFIANWRSNTQFYDAYGRARLGDLNYDGVTDLRDAFQVRRALMQNSMPTSALASIFGVVTVPEPSTVLVALFVLATAGTWHRTRRNQ